MGFECFEMLLHVTTVLTNGDAIISISYLLPNPKNFDNVYTRFYKTKFL